MNGYDRTDGSTGGEGVVAERRLDEAAADGSGALGGVSPAELAARLMGYHRCRSTLFEWIHPLRLAGIPFAECLREADAVQAAAVAEAFLDEKGMDVPPLLAFATSGAALARLPAHDCLMVFRLRALLDHSDELRSWIDRPRRARLNEWVGPRGTQLLLARGRTLGSDAKAVASRMPLNSTDADALAWLGFQLFERECGWEPDGPLALVQLAMPAQGAARTASAAYPSPRGWNPSLSIVSQLPELFPEWSW